MHRTGEATRHRCPPPAAGSLPAPAPQKNDELAALQQALSRVSAERDELRYDATAAATGSGGACAGDPPGGAAGSGHGQGLGSRPCAPGAPLGPAGVRPIRLAPGGRGWRRGGGGGGGGGAPQPPAAAPAGVPGRQASGDDAPPQPTPVSAFASHTSPFSFQ